MSEHYIKNVWRYVLLGLFGALFGFIAIAAVTIDVYMVLWLIFFKLFITAAEWMFAYMNIYRLNESEKRPRYEKYENRRIGPMFGRGNGKEAYKWLAASALVAIIVFSGLMLWQTQAVSTVNNASAFNQMLTFEPAGTPLFQHEIPDSMLRLTTEELAKSIALRSAAHFGSVQVGSAHITIYNGRLVWVVTMIPPNLWGDNTIKGLVIVDANNPELDVEIIDKPFKVGEGLMYFPGLYTGNIQGNAYWGQSTADAYGRATLTPDDNGDWKYVLTATQVQQWSFVAQPKGVYVYNELGQVQNFYNMNQIPDWVTQRYDEGWLKSMINAWGGTRRGNGFDIFARGFAWIPASTNRVEISDDVRWIVDPDTNRITALVPVDFVGEAQTMAGMFKTTDSGIEYYDTRGLDIKSGLQAQNVIESHILMPTTGAYEAEMPLIYPINGENAWFVPVYWRTAQGQSTSAQETIKLAGLGIVDAVNLDHYTIVMTGEGYQGAALVAEAKRRFEAGAVQPSNEKTITGTLNDRFSYVNNGNTIYVLTINQTDYAVYTQTLDFTTVSRIEKLQIGYTVTIIVNSNNEFIRFPS
ncbi:MAG: hypothetical protein ABSF24_09610 [Candidatus Bathyarchaeia archaeon]